MNGEDLISVWSDLRARRVPGENLSLSTPVTHNGDDTALELAVDAAGSLHLLAPVQGPSKRELPPDFNGLRLRHSRLADVECLDLQSSAAHETMFAALCGQVIEAILDDGREPWAAAISTMRAWHSAWRPLRNPMSDREQTGLAGELLMLKLVWIRALGPNAIHHWSGPDNERHDFVSEKLHMEVKATTRDRHEHEISRFDQLMVPAGRRLLFASVQLEVSVLGEFSLATLIDDLIEEIRGDAAAVDGFMTRLKDLNWSEEMRQSPELMRFHIRDVQVFDVDEDFPGLPRQFKLPPGILSLKYTISLSNLPVLASEEVLSLIEC